MRAGSSGRASAEGFSAAERSSAAASFVRETSSRSAPRRLLSRETFCSEACLAGAFFLSVFLGIESGAGSASEGSAPERSAASGLDFELMETIGSQAADPEKSQRDSPKPAGSGFPGPHLLDQLTCPVMSGKKADSDGRSRRVERRHTSCVVPAGLRPVRTTSLNSRSMRLCKPGGERPRRATQTCRRMLQDEN